MAGGGWLMAPEKNNPSLGTLTRGPGAAMKPEVRLGECRGYTESPLCQAPAQSRQKERPRSKKGLIPNL